MPICRVHTARSPGREGSWPARKRRVPTSRSVVPPSSGSPCSSSCTWSGQRKPSGIPVARVHFALAGCDACLLRARCTKAVNGRYGRSLTLRRAEQRTPERKARCDVRVGVEGAISQAVRATRTRTTPYHGLAKTHLASVLNAAALNVIRADARLNGTPLGATRVSHLARLDLAA